MAAFFRTSTAVHEEALIAGLLPPFSQKEARMRLLGVYGLFAVRTSAAQPRSLPPLRRDPCARDS